MASTYSASRDAVNEPAEVLFGDILRNSSFYIDPAQIVGKQAPALILRPNDQKFCQTISDFGIRPNLVTPDYLAMKDGKSTYYEVKAKKPFSGALTMNDCTLRHLDELESASGTPVFYVVYRTDIAPVDARNPAAFVVAPISRLKAQLGRAKLNKDGSTYYAWPLRLFDPLADHLADQHQLLPKAGVNDIRNTERCNTTH